MKKNYAIVSYLVSLAYIFIGVLLYDWTTHMAPALDGRGNSRNLFWELFLICFGLILSATSFLLMKSKIRPLYFSVLFYSGLFAILAVGFGFSASDQRPNNSLFNSYQQFLFEAAFFYAPMTILYLFRKKGISKA